VNEENAGVPRVITDLFYAITDNMECPKMLTINQIKQCNQFKNISTEQATEIINGLYKLSIITYNLFKENGVRTV
jgi:hypothetical protein